MRRAVATRAPSSCTRATLAAAPLFSSALCFHLRCIVTTGGGGFSGSKLAHPVGPSDPTPSKHHQQPAAREAEEDSSARQQQQTATASAAAGGDGSASSSQAGAVPPPRPVKRGKEAFMLELEKSERAEAQARQPKPNAAFLAKLSKIETDGAQHASSKGIFAKGSAMRKEKKKQAMASERREALVFRDVGMELDRAILSRDILLIPKYLYYGIEFAIDNELERMLRYFNEHAINEMKLINDGKLMRGPERLAKTGFPFPSVEGVTKLSTIMPSLSSLRSSGADGASASAAAPPVLAYADPKTKVTLACGSFRKPTLVVFSQLGQRVGGQADRMWREIALSYTAPSFAEQLNPKMKIDLRPSSASGSGSGSNGCDDPRAPSAQPTSTTTRTVSGGGCNGIAHSKPLDVLSLRSLDVQNYKWVHRLYVRRFVQALASNTYDTAITTATSSSSSSAVPERAPPPHDVLKAYNEWLVASTVIGSGILRPFFKEGLRNYLSPYAMLVDHRGNVRWMGSGLPDAKEKAILPKLFQQLGVEFYRDRSGASTSTAAASKQRP